MTHSSTPEAQALGEALEKHGLRVLYELPDGHKHIDLALPDAHINIEVDGSQHLENAEQILSDLDRTYYSYQLGYGTVHVPNKLVREDLTRISKAIADAAFIRIGQKTARHHPREE